MHYELYVDSLFLINFTMNLYLLMLVDRSTLSSAVTVAAPCRGAVWSGKLSVAFRYRNGTAVEAAAWGGCCAADAAHHIFCEGAEKLSEADRENAFFLL